MPTNPCSKLEAKPVSVRNGVLLTVPVVRSRILISAVRVLVPLSMVPCSRMNKRLGSPGAAVTKSGVESPLATCETIPAACTLPTNTITAQPAQIRWQTLLTAQECFIFLSLVKKRIATSKEKVPARRGELTRLDETALGSAVRDRKKKPPSNT